MPGDILSSIRSGTPLTLRRPAPPLVWPTGQRPGPVEIRCPAACLAPQPPKLRQDPVAHPLVRESSGGSDCLRRRAALVASSSSVSASSHS